MTIQVPVSYLQAPTALPLVAGRFYPSLVNGTPGSGQTVVVTANKLYGQLIWVPNLITATALIVQVTTGAAGNVRLGIYNDSSGAPGSLLLDGGTTTTTAAAVKTITISQSLSPGLYWLAAVFDAAPTCRLAAGATNVNLGFSSNTDTTLHMGVDVAFTYAALPNPFTAGSILSTVNHPRLLLGV